MVLGPNASGPWFLVITIGGLIGLVVGLLVCARLSKHGGKTGEELKADGK
jgi:F0F1-type ATP synthase assembly protein I